MKGRSLKAWRPGRGEWNRGAAAHLLRRAGFGASREEVERALEAGLEATIDDVLSRDEHDPALLGGARHLVAAGNIEQLAAWWMALILGGGAPLRERVTLLWHDHFATSDAKVDDVRLMYRQNQLLREHGLGDFRQLLHEVARDPAMLLWLDGNENKRGHPNENFAREVMELFGLGIGNYTERDVQEAARALTGWGTKGRAFHYRPAEHDDGTKTIFGQTGDFGGEEAIDLVLAHPACARRIAARLLEELVAPDLGEAAIEEAARALVDFDWNIARTIEAIVRSELFFSDRARRSRIAGPVELVAASVRALEASVAPADAARATAEMGQALFRPPSVKGWDGGRDWINAGTWLARHNHLARLAAAKGDARPDFARAFGTPDAARSAADAVLTVLAPDGCNDGYRDAVVEAAESCASTEAALVLAAQAVLTSPEYQLT
ncbi:MAG: DUF1800 domain-containing protein [Planctomycetota bacterium]